MNWKTAVMFILVGMFLGYIVGLWHQAAQKQYRHELGIEEVNR